MSKAIDSPESVGMNAQGLKRISSNMRRFVESGELRGMSSLVIRRGVMRRRV